MELVFGNNGVELVHQDGNWDLKAGFGFSPVETLVASVGACGMYVFQGILNGSKVDHEFVNAKVSFKVDEESRVRPVKEIKIDYFMKVEEANRTKAERIMELVPKSCPVMQSLKSDITVIENIHYV